ncbi:MAG: hypothetical protein GX173_06740 [Ruminococcaceae bacterium]|jgi:rhamnose utilization protein RhaD (predicted bifunctional aldolase and dehydrogenase)|nr:hypothetical protein [Oscillospiraceae bacterium]
MEKNTSFIEQHQKSLDAFVRLSRVAGRRSDYVQGGGGNTSCKLNTSLMAIKASGFRLDQIDLDKAYAVVDYQQLLDFYGKTDPRTLADVEKEGSACARSATRNIAELAALRPSVEAGFHSLLGRFVLHTHPVYANLATCSVEGSMIADQVLDGLAEKHVYIPYINPGAQLTFAVQQAIQTEIQRSGHKPAILFMQNHGLVITGDDVDYCLALHDTVNERIAQAYSVSAADWPEVAVEAVDTPAGEAGQVWRSATPWLREALQTKDWNLNMLATDALYPDQLVYLGGQVDVAEEGTMADMLGKQAPKDGPLALKCTIFRENGDVLYRCGRNEAQTIEETICAVLFINKVVRSSGRRLCTMSEAGRQFVSNWEGEHYRRNIAAR